MTISKSYPLVSDFFRTAFTAPVRFCVLALFSLMVLATSASAQRPEFVAAEYDPSTGVLEIIFDQTLSRIVVGSASLSSVNDGPSFGIGSGGVFLTSAQTGITLILLLSESDFLEGLGEDVRLFIPENYVFNESDEGNATISSRSISFVDVPANTAPTGGVSIDGIAEEGETLTANTTTLEDADGLGDLSYRWQADNADIADATSSTYTLTQAEVGKRLRVLVRYTDGHDTAEGVTSAATTAVTNVNDAPTGGVSIDGIAEEGETLTANTTTL